MTTPDGLDAQDEAPRDQRSRTLRPRNASANLIVALSFAESFDPEIYSQAAAAAAVAHASGYLSEPGAPIALTLNTLRTVCERNTVTVGLSRELSRRIRQGSVSWAEKGGLRIGEVRDLKGRFVGKATEIGKGAKVVGNAAMIATIVVEAAHLIANADIARMQREAVDKLGKLEAYHAISHEAELEQLYCRAREILAAPLIWDGQKDLREIRSKLLRLRITWRKEAARNLTQISDPRNYGWFGNVLTGQQHRDEQVVKAITDEVPRLVLLDYALRLDHALGLASDTWHESSMNIEAELVELTKLSELLANKCSYISEKRRDRVQQISSTLAYVAPYYEELLENVSKVPSEAIIPAINSSLLEVQREAI